MVRIAHVLYSTTYLSKIGFRQLTAKSNFYRFPVPLRAILRFGQHLKPCSLSFINDGGCFGMWSCHAIVRD